MPNKTGWWRGKAQTIRLAGLFGLVGWIGLVWGLDRLFPPDLHRWEEHSSLVLDADGQLLRPSPTPDGTWRLPLTAEQVDPLYLSMLVAVEDQRFGWHPGFDPVAAGRALGQLLIHRHVVSGASTLPMQVARLLSPRPRTVRAKLVESLRAMQLQARLGTEGILRLYLTLAPFGGPLEGVWAASQSWFGKLPRHLTPAEAALLVALPQLPERLRPDRFPLAAEKARNRVLDRAVQRGVIGADVAEAAKQEAVPRQKRPMPVLAPHLSDRLVGAGQVGRVVRTSVQRSLQERVEDLARRQKSRLEPEADLAILVVHNRSRQILASVGGADWQRQQVDLTQAVRSPGSALKPFIYAVAFEDLSLHPQTLLLDSPQRFGDWLPHNFDHDYHGLVTAREALQRSLNVPAVQVLERVGAARMAALLQQSGARLSFPDTSDVGLPLVLGGVGIRLQDLAMLYAGLSDGGSMRPLTILADQPVSPGFSMVGRDAARATIDILDGSPMPDGASSSQYVSRTRRIAFKTGTSFGFRDAWTVGSSPDYTIAVWVGRPDGAPRPGQLGRTAAAPVLFLAFDLLPPDRAPRPAPVHPDHALFRRSPPPGLVQIEPNSRPVQQGGETPLRILFPPNGATIERLPEGIALRTHGGTPPVRWVINNVPQPEGISFWQPDSDGSSRLVAVDAAGRRSVVTIRIQSPF